MNLLEINQLTLRFGGLTALSNVNLQIPLQKIFSLIGPNGAGKTTLFNVISGLYEPASGSIRLDGAETGRPLRWTTIAFFAWIGLITAIGLVLLVNIEPLWETVISARYHYRQAFSWAEGARSAINYLAALSVSRVLWLLLLGLALGVGGAVAVWRQTRHAPEVTARGGIARTFQNIRLFKQMTVLDNVLVGMDTQLRANFWHATLRLPLFWREKECSVQEAMDILRFVGLEREVRQIAENLSYGHQRRLEIARALAMKPRLLLLDEPAAGMNPTEIAEIITLARKIRDSGVTILLIEHQMPVVMGISDRIVVLDHGEVIAEGTPAEVRNNAKVIEAYLGKG